MNQEESLDLYFLKKIYEIVISNTANDANHTFNPKTFFTSVCPPYYSAFFIKTVSYSPKKLYSFLMDKIHESFNSILVNNNYSQFCYTTALMKLMQTSLMAYPGKDDVLNEKQFISLISIASELNKISDPTNFAIINETFIALTQTCSFKASKQITFFISEINRRLNMIRAWNEQHLTTDLNWLIGLTLNSIVTFDRLDIFLRSIPLFQISIDYLKDLFISIVNSYKNILVLMPNSYIPFLVSNPNRKYSDSLYDLINLVKPSEQTVQIRTILLLMEKSLTESESFKNTEMYRTLARASYLSGSDPLLVELLFSLIIIISTYFSIDDKVAVESFMKCILTIVVDFYQTNFKVLKELDKGKDTSKVEMILINIITIQFPLFVLFLSPSTFSTVILPILKTSDLYYKSIIEISSAFAKRTKHRSKNFCDIYPTLFEPLSSVIFDAKQNNSLYVNIQSLMNSLKDNQYFLRSFIFSNNNNTFLRLLEIPGINPIFFKSVYNNASINEPLESNFWTITKELTDFIVSSLETTSSQKFSFLGVEKITFYVELIRFIKQAIKKNQDINQDDIQTIVDNFEVIGYSILSMSHKFPQIDPMIFFKNFVSVIKNSGLSIQCAFEQIDSFIKINERNPKIAFEFSMIFKRSQIVSEGMKKAVKVLFPRLQFYAYSLTGKDTNESTDSITLLELQNSQADLSSGEMKLYNYDSQTFKLPSDTLTDIEQCIYVLLPMLREITDKYNDVLLLLLTDNTKNGIVCRTLIGNALAPQLYFGTFVAINSRLRIIVKENSDLSQNGFYENSLVLMKILLNNEIWIPNSNYSSLFSSILDCIVSLFSKTKKNCQKEFCEFVIALFNLINRVDFPITINSNLRNTIAKLIFTWINQNSEQKVKSLLKLNFDALYLVFDGLNFLEIKGHEGKTSNSEAVENFLFYYSQIRSIVTYGLDENNTNATQKLLAEDALKLISAMLKNNLDIFINHTISLAIDGKIKIRTAYLHALTYVLTPEVYDKFVSPVIKHNLVDLVFISDFEIMRFLANSTPYNKAADVASALVEASALKGIEMEVFEDLVKIEMSNNKDPTRNTLFRGNAVPSRAVSYFPKYFADDWANLLIRPLLSLNASDIKQFWPALISRIEEMFPLIPDRLKNAIQILFKLLAPESTQIAFSMLSGFIFLRFLCPMLAKVEGFVEVSSLLMSVSIKPTISENRPQFFCMKEEAEDSYNRIQNLFSQMVGFDKSRQENGLNYTLPTFEIKPLNLLPDSEKVTENLCSALWTQMPLFQQKLRETSEDLSIHQTLDKLIAKLEEMGKPIPTKIATVNMHVPLGENLKSSLAELLKMPHDAQLEKWFYLTQTVAEDNSLVFMMKMSEITKPYTAQQLCSYIFTQLLLIGESQYTVVVDFSDFDILLLPAASQLKKVLKFAESEMVSRLSMVYVLRIQDSAATYLNKASKLLKKLPKQVQMITDISMLHKKLGNIELSQTTTEYFSTPESTFELQTKSNYPLLRLHQNSIQVIDKFEINQCEYFSSKVILLSSIDSIRQPEAIKSMSSFLIRFKDGRSYPVQSPNAIQIHKAVSKLFVRFNFGKEMKKNDLFVDRSSFRSLLLILSFVNMITDIGDQELKAAAYNLYIKTIESSGLKTNIEKRIYTSKTVPYSLLETVESISNDLAKSNTHEVHNFFFEFVKLIPYLNSQDYSNSERYIEPWIHYSSEEIINNALTLEYLAKIVTKTPKKCFMQFNKNIWRNFNHMNLMNSLFNKLCFYEEGCFASIFLSISVKYSKEVTSFLIEKLDEFSTDQFQRQFEKLTVIMVNMIVSKLFDETYKPKLLHFLSVIRLTPNQNIIKLSFTIFRSLFLNESYENDLFTFSKSQESFISDENVKIDFGNFLVNTAKIALLYRYNYSESLIDLFNEDFHDENQLNRHLNSLIFLSALKDDYKLSFEIYKKSQSYKSLSATSIALAITANSIPRAVLNQLFFTSIASMLCIEQSTPFYLISYILKTLNIQNFETELLSNVPKKSIVLFDSITGLSFEKKPLSSFLIFLVPFYVNDAIDIQPIINHFESIPTNNKEDILIYQLMKYNFDEKDNDILKLIDSKNENQQNEELANIAALSVLLCFKQPRQHIKRFVTSLLDTHPEYFSSINFLSFFESNSSNFKFIGSKLIILLSKSTNILTTEDPILDVKYKPNSILTAYFDGQNTLKLTSEQMSSIFNEFLVM